MARHNAEAEAIDTAIGERINELRISIGLSMQQLSDKIGVTHQQTQKYVKGTNRISAGRLVAISKALNKPVAYFFEGIEKAEAMPTQHTRMCIEVSRNFLKIKSPAVQIGVNNLMRTLAQNS
jgi:transcriptional regulator with XRE-family HTH domain